MKERESGKMKCALLIIDLQKIFNYGTAADMLWVGTLGSRAVTAVGTAGFYRLVQKVKL